MQWDVIRQKILEVIAECVRVDTCWRDREQDAIRRNTGNESGVICKLNVYGTQSVGRDDFRQEYNGTSHLIDLTQVSNKTFTLSCLCESFDQGDTKTALNYTERIRSCLQRTAVLADLRTVNVTVMSVGTSVDVSYTYDDRQVSAANIDVAIACTVNEHANDGPGLNSIGWIEKLVPDPEPHLS